MQQKIEVMRINESGLEGRDDKDRDKSLSAVQRHVENFRQLDPFRPRKAKHLAVVRIKLQSSDEHAESSTRAVRFRSNLLIKGRELVNNSMHYRPTAVSSF